MNRVTVYDCLCILFWLAVAVLLLWQPWRPASATGEGWLEVRVAGRCVYSRPARLDMTRTFTGYQGHRCVVEARHGRVRVLKADCPDQLCRSTGWAGPGRQIICLPARISIRITGREVRTDMDGITR